MSRPQSYKRLYLTPEEIARREAPAGMPVKGATATPGRGDKQYTPIHAGSAAAVAAAAERKFARERPDLVAKREKAGK